MKGFEPVTLTWAGEDYSVPAARQMMLIAEIEDAISGRSGIPALAILARGGGPSHSRLAGAYGAALRYAGAAVTDEAIYLAIMEGFAAADADNAVLVQDAVLGLLSIISPPAARALAARDDGAKKKSPISPAPD